MNVHFPHSSSSHTGILDTGAGISLIEESLVKDLPKRTDVILDLNGIGSESTTGCVTLAFEVAAYNGDEWVDLQFSHTFHCMKRLLPGLLLGSDFIYAFGVLVDGVKQLASIENWSWKIWPLRSTDAERVWTVDAPLSTINLITVGTSSIPARHHAWVKFATSRPIPNNDSLSIIPSLWQEDSRDIFLCVQGAVLAKAWTYMLVSNLGTTDCSLPSNVPLAQACALSDHVCPLGPEQVFTLDAAPKSPHEINTAELTRRLQEEDLPTDLLHDPSESSPDVEDREQLAADATTLVDGTYNVGPACTPEILAVLRRFSTVFATDGKPGHVTSFPLKIPLRDNAVLTPEPPRRTSPEKRDVIDATIKQLLEHDIIEPSSSCTSYPLLLVKQGPKWRMCVDYRGLNSVTVEDRYPLPRTEDVFETLSSGRIFSSVDAISGYFQLDVEEQDRYKTAFVCHQGLFQFKRIPFGLKNAPAHFQRFMDTLLGSMRWRCAMVYLDDAVIFSNTAQEHAEHLTMFLDKCKEYGLRLSPKKCFFAVTSLHLLGRLISVDGVSVIPDRAAAVRHLAEPTNLQELYHVLGLFNYYRPFIPRFALLASRLTTKTKGTRYQQVESSPRYQLVKDGVTHTSAKSVPITFDDEDRKAFKELKDALCRQVTLAYPDRTKDWFLYVDASKEGYAAALHQQFVKPQTVENVANVEATAEALPVVATIPATLPQAPEIATLQREDPLWKRIIDTFERENRPTAGYALIEGLLVRTDTDAICLPKKLTQSVFEEAHRSHCGFARTYSRVSASFWHPSLAEMVRAYVKHCPHCLRTKLSRRSGRMDPDNEFLGLPFHTVAMDVMQSLPGQKNACLIIVDLFSKMVLLHPTTTSVTAVQIAHAFEHMVLRKGWKPSRIITDGDLRFTGEVASALAEKIGAKLTPSAPYHQQANPAERYVQTVKGTLKAMLLDEDPARWPDKIAAVELALNSTPSTVTGYSPFDLIYCHRPATLLSALAAEHSNVASVRNKLNLSAARIKQASEAIKAAQLQQKQRYDARRQNLPDWKEGDLAMIRLDDRPLLAGRQARTGLDADLEGPFRIKKILSPHRVELDLPPDMAVKQPFDVTQLQRVPRSDEDPFDREGLTVEEPNALFQPQAIVDERVLNGYKQYYTKWLNSSRLTWEFEEDLLEFGCHDLIAEWQEQSHRLATPPLPDVFTGEPRSAVDPFPILTRSSEEPGTGTAPTFPSAREANDHKPSPIKRDQTRLIDGKLFTISERPVAFTSRETRPGEKKLAAVELEASALAWAYHKLLPLFEGCHVNVITDHSPLGPVIHGSGQKVFSSTLVRARYRLSPYAHLLTFHHRPGVAHGNVDALSRLRSKELSLHNQGNETSALVRETSVALVRRQSSPTPTPIDLTTVVRDSNPDHSSPAALVRRQSIVAPALSDQLNYLRFP